jgi:Tol biopolymer transport system component
VFVYDRVRRTTVRASVSSSGVQGDAHSVAPAISGDGRFVAFCSGSSALVPGGPVHGWDLYVHDLRAGRTTRAGPGSCFERPALSRDGRWVAYLTSAPEFEPGGWIAFDSTAQLLPGAHEPHRQVVYVRPLP